MFSVMYKKADFDSKVPSRISEMHRILYRVNEDLLTRKPVFIIV